MFEAPQVNIYYCYGIWQELFEVMKRDIANIVFLEGLPNREILEQRSASVPHVQSFRESDNTTVESATGDVKYKISYQHNIIILDDLMPIAAKKIRNR